MKTKERREAKRLVKMVAFSRLRVSDFTHAIPTLGDRKHAKVIVDMEGQIKALGGEAAGGV